MSPPAKSQFTSCDVPKPLALLMKKGRARRMKLTRKSRRTRMGDPSRMLLRPAASRQPDRIRSYREVPSKLTATNQQSPHPECPQTAKGPPPDRRQTAPRASGENARNSGHSPLSFWPPSYRHCPVVGHHAWVQQGRMKAVKPPQGHLKATSKRLQGVFTRAAPSTSGRAKNQIPISNVVSSSRCPLFQEGQHLLWTMMITFL